MSTSKRNLYIALVVLGGGAMIVDRFLLGYDTPATAAAQPSMFVSSGLEPKTVEPTDSRDDPWSIPELPFPKDLPSFDPNVPFHSPFDPPSASTTPIGEDVTDNDASRNGPSGVRGRTSWTKFAAQHKLDAIFSSQGLKIAIIDGAWLREGHTVSGCRVINIGETTVTFACWDGPAQLAIVDLVGLPED